MNRQERRSQEQRIRQHQSHGKLIRALESDPRGSAEVLCAKCSCHISFLDQEEWLHLVAFDTEYTRQAAEYQRLNDYIYGDHGIRLEKD